TDPQEDQIRTPPGSESHSRREPGIASASPEPQLSVGDLLPCTYVPTYRGVSDWAVVLFERCFAAASRHLAKSLEAPWGIANTAKKWHMSQRYPNDKTVHRRFQIFCRSEILCQVLTDIANYCRIIELLVVLDSEVRKRGRRKMMRTSESGHYRFSADCRKAVG